MFAHRHLTRLVVAVSTTAFSGAVLIATGCNTTTNDTATPPTATVQPAASGTASASGSAAASGAAVPSSTSSSAATSGSAKPADSCKPWGPAPAQVTARNGGGRADFFREVTYDFATGTAGVHDSDPFANGNEAKVARVIQRREKLKVEQKADLERALAAVCADEEAFKAMCAPGGCSRISVTHADGSKTTLEHVPTVSAVMRLIEPFFPELRTQK